MDIAAVISAVAGAVALLAGAALSRRGQVNTEHQQNLADVVTRDQGRLKETQQALDVYELLIKTLQTEAGRASDSADQMRSDLGLERAARSTDTINYGLIEAKCRRQSDMLVSALSMLAEMPIGDQAHQVVTNAQDHVTEHPHTKV